MITCPSARRVILRGANGPDSPLTEDPVDGGGEAEEETLAEDGRNEPLLLLLLLLLKCNGVAEWRKRAPCSALPGWRQSDALRGLRVCSRSASASTRLSTWTNSRHASSEMGKGMSTAPPPRLVAALACERANESQSKMHDNFH
jgi:hypothetical protein